MITNFFKPVNRLTFLLYCLIGLHQFAVAQDRIVEDRKVFICTMSDRDTFKTAAEGCRHWAKVHLPGYKFQEGSDVTQPNGAVKCICTKTGSGNNEQQGQIMGIIICPENASELNVTPNSFEERKCQCYQTYVSYNGKCVKPEDVPEDECDAALGLTKPQVELKKQTIERLQQIVDKTNKAFARDPTISKKVFSKAELDHYGPGGYLPYLWYQGYGHALERLTAQAVAQDPLLSTTLEYIPNVQQTKGLPDFRGKGSLPSTLSFDITTEGQVDKKKTKGKECWEFILYKRLVNADGTKVKP